LSRMSEVAKRLGIRPEALERDALRLWLKRRLRLVEAEIASILSKYGVVSSQEIEAKIRRGELPEHPAWEDVIVLENLEEERRHIIEVLGEIERASS